MKLLQSKYFDFFILSTWCLMLGIIIWQNTSKKDFTANEIKRAEEERQNQIQKTRTENEYKLKISDLECINDSINLYHSNSKPKIIIRYEKERFDFISNEFSKRVIIWTNKTKQLNSSN